ncbi:MAG: NlpC/P60 family protein [Pseudomonadota bacterium]
MTRDPRITAARPDLAARALEGAVLAERFVDGTPMVVTAPVLDLTRSPDRGVALDTQLLSGEVFTVYEYDGDTGLAWGQSETDGYVGYVSVAGLETADGPVDHVVSALATHIYPEPALKTRPLEALPMGAAFRAGPVSDGFVEVAGGGFVPAQHVARKSAFASDPVEVAERFIGVPYLWGGRSAFGLDCSALVQLAFAACGTALPRDSDQQDGAIAAIAGPLQRGDLVFWSGHVGIMADGESLVHANAHHMSVVKEPLAEAEARIAAQGEGPVTARRRVSP